MPIGKKSGLWQYHHNLACLSRHHSRHDSLHSHQRQEELPFERTPECEHISQPIIASRSLGNDNERI